MDDHARRGPGSHDEPGPRRSRDRPGREALDPYERAVLRGQDPDAAPEDDGPPPLPKLTAGPLRVGGLGLAVGLLAIVGLAALARGDRTPDLAADCDAPAVALSTTSVRPGGLVEFTVVGRGPAVVAVDAAQVDPRTLAATTVTGAPATVVSERLPLDGCRATGRFGAQLPPGEHVVTVFRLTGDGATRLASERLEVLDR